MAREVYTPICRTPWRPLDAATAAELGIELANPTNAGRTVEMAHAPAAENPRKKPTPPAPRTGRTGRVDRALDLLADVDPRGRTARPRTVSEEAPPQRPQSDWDRSRDPRRHMIEQDRIERARRDALARRPKADRIDDVLSGVVSADEITRGKAARANAQMTADLHTIAQAIRNGRL